MTAATLPKYPVSAKATTTAEAVVSESRIDSDSHFNGLYETRQNLRIEGVAEGEIQCEGTLTVAQGARVKAKVTASTITIAGELEGEVTCRGVFQIMPSGQVEATVSARRLIVQEGGFYNGDFRMITDEPVVHDQGRTTHGAKPAGAKEAAKELAHTDKKPDTNEEAEIGTDEWWAKMAGAPPPKDDDKPKATS